jgi:hypothetical protein
LGSFSLASDLESADHLPLDWLHLAVPPAADVPLRADRATGQLPMGGRHWRIPFGLPAAYLLHCTGTFTHCGRCLRWGTGPPGRKARVAVVLLCLVWLMPDSPHRDARAGTPRCVRQP